MGLMIQEAGGNGVEEPTWNTALGAVCQEAFLVPRGAHADVGAIARLLARPHATGVGYVLALVACEITGG